MNAYAHWVHQWPLLSAALQFALLGTLGEVLAGWLATRRLPFPLAWLPAKMLAWAVLGVVIKLGFVMMKGASAGLLAWLGEPALLSTGVGRALLVSVLTNLFFGPQMMAFHRLEDNLIAGTRNWQGLDRAWKSLIWFWIPAHTLTFSLPTEYQLGLAALWSVALGLILGLSRDPRSN
ncbi:MAG: hypothetical protein KDC10_08315 [Calditrichaeota bacterium]|nr:hypothetical protein [Calditrichota bacterium]